MIKDYSVLFNGMDDNKRVYYYFIGGDKDREVIQKVYNQYFGLVEWQRKMILAPNVSYYTSIPSNSKHRYVEFRDAETLEIVGLFGLEGITDYSMFDINDYIKTIAQSLDFTSKRDINHIFNEVFGNGIYNNEFVFVEENDIVFDIGFNYGIFTLDALKNKPYKIFGFEPNKKLIDSFNRFIQNDSVVLHNVAVSDKSETIMFYENYAHAMSSIDINMNSSISQIKNSYEVKAITLNDFVTNNNISKIDYLKVDCEGAEYQIFDSLSNEFLTNKIRKIALEFHHTIDNPKVVKLIDKIKQCGFETKIDYNDGDTTGMLYARK